MTEKTRIHPYVYCGLAFTKEGYYHETVDTIVISVCESLKIKPEIVLSSSRVREVVEARQLCMFFVRKLKELPYMKIGKMFRRDHATVIHAVNQVTNLLEFSYDFRTKYWKVANDLGNFSINNVELFKYYNGEDEKTEME